jgi:NAD(P)-dependent dehydrogenase (short-subunit alcohol dehydrogenase family)
MSRLGRIAVSNSAACCASNGAIEQLTRVPAAELAPTGIRVDEIVASDATRRIHGESVLVDSGRAAR